MQLIVALQIIIMLMTAFFSIVWVDHDLYTLPLSLDV